jgi:hypothetical protein
VAGGVAAAVLRCPVVAHSARDSSLSVTSAYGGRTT